MCQQAFLLEGDAHAIVKASNADAARTAKTAFHGKPEAIIKEAIRSSVTLPDVSREKLAKTAEETRGTEGDFVFATRRRTDQTLGRNPVCFNAVRLWLFNAGFVSLRWLASTGYGLDANTCNQILGDGVEIEPDDLAQMPRGYMFNFHARRSKPTCHWGICLGGGWAAGSNTTAEYQGAARKVDFKSGNSVYGVFDLSSSYEVCKAKYKLTGEEVGDVVIRKIDPLAVTTYF